MTLPAHRSPCRRAGCPGGPAAGADPLEREVAALDGEHARRSQSARLGEPAQAVRLGRVLADWSVLARLHERLAAVRHKDVEGLVDVTPADAPRIARAGRE